MAIAPPLALTMSGAISVRWWPLHDADLTAREPVTYWPSPEITLTPDVADTPVLVTVRYRVPVERHDTFLDAVAALRNSRLRTGGTSWRLYRDGADPTGFVEQYTVASWDEHLAQHDGRLTGLDQQAQQRVDTLAERIDPAEHLFQIRP